jgi:hypothetical protein
MTNSKKRGRPATGRTSRVERVPLDINMGLAVILYYDILPILKEHNESLKGNEHLPRYDRLKKLMDSIAPHIDLAP